MRRCALRVAERSDLVADQLASARTLAARRARDGVRPRARAAARRPTARPARLARPRDELGGLERPAPAPGLLGQPGPPRHRAPRPPRPDRDPQRLDGFYASQIPSSTARSGGGLDLERADLEGGECVVEVGHQVRAERGDRRDRPSGCATGGDPRRPGTARPRCRRTAPARPSARRRPRPSRARWAGRRCSVRRPCTASRRGRPSAGGSRSRGTGCPTRRWPARDRSRRRSGSAEPCIQSAGSTPAMAQNVGARSTWPTGSDTTAGVDRRPTARAARSSAGASASRCGTAPCRRARSRPAARRGRW